jgi:hypothetical protein
VPAEPEDGFREALDHAFAEVSGTRHPDSIRTDSSATAGDRGDDGVSTELSAAIRVAVAAEVSRQLRELMQEGLHEIVQAEVGSQLHQVRNPSR